MTEADCYLPESINPNHFPAKLWCMVNDPANIAICWDNTGEFIVIYQALFEKFVLSHCCKDDEGNFSYFKTTQFSSFVRQLNLYGFRKAEPPASTVSIDPIHHYFNSNFRRDNPALLIHLKRLTVNNKAKMDRGMDVKCRPQRKSQKRVMKGRAGNLSSHPYTHRKLLTPDTGTPDRSRHLVQGPIAPSLGYPYSAGLSSALQQGVTYGINYGVPNFTGIQPQNEQYYSQSFQHIPLMDMPNGLNAPFPPISYNWVGSIEISFLHLLYWSCNHYPPNIGDGPGPSSPKKNEEEEGNHKTDVNLDRNFQMADELKSV
ncbi:heat shock factor protein 5-like [Eucyclogobius newberryi]|uniref:heat shock factor protein 5-like n=1 Tax=Eucyclogobius newberryi TaxID=166745 RepID=UPI003B596890